MQIGEIIRKFRKEKNMTQEELAKSLGVTAPAVNKWENGNSLPDIMLLAPIARVLGITVDFLLSFKETLTDEEITQLLNELSSRLKQESYAEVFAWARQKLEEYPNCERLILWMIQVLDGQRDMVDVPDAESYDGYIRDCYVRVLDSREEEIKNAAADALFHFYMRKEQYDKAEKYLVYFSKENPERKRKQAMLCSRSGRKEEAYKLYEELLFSGYQGLSMVFQGLYSLAMEGADWAKAHRLVEKLGQLAKLFEMGAYQEVSAGLELAVAEKNVEATIQIMERMLANLDTVYGFVQSPLYEHMTFKSPREELLTEIRKNLLEQFRDEETFGFLKDDLRWKELVGE